MEPRGHWYRSYEEMSKDPKFRVVARRASATVPGVRTSDAIAVWVNLLERASQAPERGVIEGFDGESCDALFDLPDGAACALVEAFKDKGMIESGRIAKWESRQPQRERPGDLSTERTRRFKEKNKQGTPGNAEGTPGNAPDQSRTEQNKTEELDDSSSHSSSAAADDSASSPLPCPTSAIIAAYHAILPERPVVRFPGKKLLQHLKARMAEDYSRRSVEWWEEYFRDVRGKPWLMGQGDWAGANLHWLVGPENMSKVLNGQYDERKKSESALDTWKPKELRQ